MLEKRKLRKDFLIRDLAVSIGGGGGGTWMPGPDDETPPTPISPIASVVVNIDLITAVRTAMTDAAKAKNFDEIGRAFEAGGTGGSPVIRSAIEEIGRQVVASAAYASMGGSVGFPVDDGSCGTSLETIPTPITPIVHVGREVHRVSELPRLRRQLAEAVA